MITTLIVVAWLWTIALAFMIGLILGAETIDNPHKE